MSAESLLADAAALLANGSSWGQGANARNAAGKAVPILSSEAVTWDVFGALQKAHYNSGLETFRDFHAAYAEMKRAIPPGFRNRDIESYNDFAQSFEEITVLFGAALPGGATIYISAIATEGGELLTDEDETFFFQV